MRVYANEDQHVLNVIKESHIDLLLVLGTKESSKIPDHHYFFIELKIPSLLSAIQYDVKLDVNTR